MEEQVRLALFQRRSLRAKGVQGNDDTIVQVLVDIPLFTLSVSLEVDESRKTDGSGDEKEEDGTIAWLQLPSTPVLAPNTRTKYLDIDHSLVLTRVAPESKAKSIVAEGTSFMGRLVRRPNYLFFLLLHRCSMS